MKGKIALILTAIFLAQTVPVRAFTIPGVVKKTEERYREAKKEYLQEKREYLKTRRQYSEARKKIQLWRALSPEEKSKNLDQAKQYILRGIEVAIRHLQRWRNRIEAMRGVENSWRAEALEEIDQQINWLERKRQEIEKASSPEELREEGQKVRNYWQEHRLLVKKFVGKILASRVKWIISRAELIYGKLEKAVDRAEEMGKDVSRAREILAELKEKISLAKEKVELAVEKFEAISNLAEANQLFREGHQFLKEAHQYLREFRQGVREVWQELK